MSSTTVLQPPQEPSTSTSEHNISHSIDMVSNGGESSNTTTTICDNDTHTNGTQIQKESESSTSTSTKDETEEKKTEEVTEEMKLKYANWPYRDIKEPHANDVLYGRGGTFLGVAVRVFCDCSGILEASLIQCLISFFIDTTKNINNLYT